VSPDLNDLTASFSLTPYEYVGIPIALVGAIFLSLGAHYQHRGVVKVDATTIPEERAGLSVRQLLSLLARPSWVVGTLMLGLAVLLQLTSLNFAPLTVVQPLGAVGLVLTSVLTARTSGVPLDAASKRAIAFCIGGIAIFVTVAAMTTESPKITETQLITVLVILGVVLTACAVLFGFLRKRVTAIFYIVGAGVLFGFVATLAKVVIGRIQTLIALEFERGGIEWLTIACVIGLLAAAALGSYFVQTAYSNGPPDLVVAGLTVIDPIIAITIALIVLGEASQAPAWAIVAFLVAGAIAVYGVFQLAKHHPQVRH
jgi:drug/metabolite transporter (DMT)-like permease